MKPARRESLKETGKNERSVASADGEISAAAGDIAEQKRAEAELKRYRDHLEEMIGRRASQLTEGAAVGRVLAELVRADAFDTMSSVTEGVYKDRSHG